MARVTFTNEQKATGKELEAYLELKNKGKLTNMKEALLLDYATYDAYMGWYTSWNRLVEENGRQLFMRTPFPRPTAASYAPCSLSAI